MGKRDESLRVEGVTATCPMCGQQHPVYNSRPGGMYQVYHKDQPLLVSVDIAQQFQTTEDEEVTVTVEKPEEADE